MLSKNWGRKSSVKKGGRGIESKFREEYTPLIASGQIIVDHIICD